MRRMWQRFLAVALVLAFAPASLFGVGGGERMVIVADSRGLSGWRAWWTNLYNENHLLLALLTILIIPTAGLLLGKITGWLLAMTGINLKSRELAEH